MRSINKTTNLTTTLIDPNNRMTSQSWIPDPLWSSVKLRSWVTLSQFLWCKVSVYEEGAALKPETLLLKWKTVARPVQNILASYPQRCLSFSPQLQRWDPASSHTQPSIITTNTNTQLSASRQTLEGGLQLRETLVASGHWNAYECNFIPGLADGGIFRIGTRSQDVKWGYGKNTLIWCQSRAEISLFGWQHNEGIKTWLMGCLSLISYWLRNNWIRNWQIKICTNSAMDMIDASNCLVCWGVVCYYILSNGFQMADNRRSEPF